MGAGSRYREKYNHEGSPKSIFSSRYAFSGAMVNFCVETDIDWIRRATCK